MNLRDRIAAPLVMALLAALTGIPTAAAAADGQHGDAAPVVEILDAHLPDGTVATAAAPSGTPACPTTVASAEFGDVHVASTHARTIDCLAWWGVSVGDGNYSYGPGKSVTRAQNASFLTRALDMTTRPLPADGEVPLPPGVGLPDVVSGTSHATSVLRTVASGVMRPRKDGTFAGAEPLRRDEMAVAIVAAYDRATDDTSPPPSPGGRFDDLDGHPDAAVIERAYDLGFTSGYTDTSFAAKGEVNRAQMASFLTRLLDRLVTDAYADPPEVPAWGLVPPGRRPVMSAPGEGTTFAFLDKRSDGTPVRWNRCDPLPVYANYDGAQPGAAAALERAVKLLTDAMGFKVHLAGATDATVGEGGAPPQIPGQLTVAWARIAGPGLIGFGGPSYQGYYGRDMHLVGGGVAINSGWANPSHDELTLGLMHELGHAVGLDHVDDPAQVMYPSLTHGKKVQWGNGDLVGLGLLGHDSPCVGPLQP